MIYHVHFSFYSMFKHLLNSQFVARVIDFPKFATVPCPWLTEYGSWFNTVKLRSFPRQTDRNHSSNNR